MSFKIFQDTGVRTKEYISITSNKKFGLPRTFLAKQNISNAHKAVLMYDADEKKVAIHFTLAEPKFGHKVSAPDPGQGAIISASSFFELNDIDTVKYGGRYDQFEKVLLTDIGINRDGYAYVIALKEKLADEKEDQVGAEPKNEKEEIDIEVPF